MNRVLKKLKRESRHNNNKEIKYRIKKDRILNKPVANDKIEINGVGNQS